MAKRVIIYTCHNGLLLRDQSDYHDMLELAGFRASVQYRSSLNEPVEQLDTLLFDEADYFVFSDPKRFENLCQRRQVICMSATIPDSSANKLEYAVLERLKFKIFSYCPSSLQMQKRLASEHTLEAPDEGKLIEKLSELAVV